MWENFVYMYKQQEWSLIISLVLYTSLFNLQSQTELKGVEYESLHKCEIAITRAYLATFPTLQKSCLLQSGESIKLWDVKLKAKVVNPRIAG